MVRSTGARALALAVALTTLAGCSGPAPEAARTASATPSGAAYQVVPEPGRTIVATPAVGDATGSLAGYRIAVVVRQDAATSAGMLAAARALAAARGAELLEFAASTPDDDGVDAALAAALETDPDLVIGLGDPVVDVFSLQTAQWLGQQFLLVGAQLAEPTGNVTAVIWDGATSRGSAASSDGELNEASVTEARASDALAVGIDSVRDGVTGVVLALATSTAVADG